MPLPAELDPESRSEQLPIDDQKSGKPVPPKAKVGEQTGSALQASSTGGVPDASGVGGAVSSPSAGRGASAGIASSNEMSRPSSVFGDGFMIGVWSQCRS